MPFTDSPLFTAPPLFAIPPAVYCNYPAYRTLRCLLPLRCTPSVPMLAATALSNNPLLVSTPLLRLSSTIYRSVHNLLPSLFTFHVNIYRSLHFLSSFPLLHFPRCLPPPPLLTAATAAYRPLSYTALASKSWPKVEGICP